VDLTKKLNILLVEDDPRDLALLKRAIAEDTMRADFYFVDDGQQAIEYLRGEGPFGDRRIHPFPELVLLDLKMPRVSGFEVLQWLRDHAECSRLPVVFLSGAGLQRDVEKAYELGANSYFAKPNSNAALVALLRALVSYWFLAERPAVPQKYA